jgi:hypothetical protein
MAATVVGFGIVEAVKIWSGWMEKVAAQLSPDKDFSEKRNVSGRPFVFSVQ